MDFRQLLEQLKNIEEARMGKKETSAGPKEKMTFGFEVEIAYSPEFDEDGAREQARIEAEDDEELFVTPYDLWEESTGTPSDITDMVDDYLTPTYGFAKKEDVVQAQSEQYKDIIEKFKILYQNNKDSYYFITRYSKRFSDEYQEIKNRNLPNYDDFAKSFYDLVIDNYTYDENKDYGDTVDKMWVYDDEDLSDITYIPNIDHNDLEDYFEDTRELENYLDELANEKREEKIDEYVENRVEEMREEFLEDEEGNHFAEAADIFENVFDTDYHVDIHDDYHSKSKDSGNYTIEPDSSIGIGIEVVSPVFDNYEEFLSELEKVFEIIDDHVYFSTTTATGLHINIGYTDMVDKLDILKMLLFMGESYIASDFGRLYNTFTTQSLDVVKSIMSEKPSATYKDSIEVINFNLLKNVNKYRTVNLQHIWDGYLEFRVMGGKDYHRKWDKIVSNIGRFVRIIEISSDETAYRKDYFKKLAKLIQGVDPRELLKIRGTDGDSKEVEDFPVPVLAKIRSFFSKYLTSRRMSGFSSGYYANKYAFVNQILENSAIMDDLKTPSTRTMVRNFVSEINKYTDVKSSTITYWTTLLSDQMKEMEKSGKYIDEIKFLRSLL
jgi:hypothetical protein